MASAEENGEVSIRFISADGSRQKESLRARTDALNYATKGSNVDRRQLYPIPFNSRLRADEKSQVVLMFKADAVDILESEESEARIDVTLIDKKTGAMTPTSLTFANMTGFTSAGTVDTTCPASVWTQLAYYEVPVGLQLCLGHPNGEGKALVYLGDDTA